MSDTPHSQTSNAFVHNPWRAMRYLVLLIFLGALFPVTACSQNGTGGTQPSQAAATGPILFGGPENDDGVAVVAAGDGGWYVVANTHSYGAGGEDIWLIKTDSGFTAEWDRTFGTATDDHAWNAVSDGAGGILIAGHTGTYESQTGDLIFIRVDARGETLWHHTYAIPGHQGRGHVQRVGEDGYVLSGWSTEPGEFSDYLLLRTDASGEELWHRTYGENTGQNGANAVLVAPDGGFAIFGEGLWTGGEDYEIWQGILVRTDAEGTELWHREYGGAGAEEGYGLALTPDDGFIVGGFSNSDNRQGAYCVKCDASGNQLWWQRLAPPFVAFSIEPVPGGYLVVGPGGLARIDEEGETLWARQYSSPSEVFSLALRDNGGIVIVGSTTNGSAGGKDVALLLTDGEGNPL